MLNNYYLIMALNSNGSTGISGGPTDYQFVSASIKGNNESGSILFHANNVANNNGDFIKRYKFFGNKVCNVLGVPENYWIYCIFIELGYDFLFFCYS